ncbi:hypothetical protein LSAT2_007425 [Lamellibrachia satsuma]|nr:hypothetical protein LSAT2_007425 [Lamellibrachia satsuma]
MVRTQTQVAILVVALCLAASCDAMPVWCMMLCKYEHDDCVELCNDIPCKRFKKACMKQCFSEWKSCLANCVNE